MSKFEAEAHDLGGIRACAETYGFCLVRNVFSPADLASFKSAMRALDAKYGKDIPDIMSCDGLNQAITNARVLEVARALLGQDIVYYPENAVNYEAEAGQYTNNPFNVLHCDAVGMPGQLFNVWRSPTDEIYRGYRFGVYFQDYSLFSGGLKVGVGSHKGDPDEILKTDGLDKNKSSTVEAEPGRVLQFYEPRVTLHDIQSRPGDLVVWNLRTAHAAGFRALKNVPGLALHPKIESQVAAQYPQFLKPVTGPRLAFFFDLAAPAQDIDLYIKARSRILDGKGSVRYIDANYDGPAATETMKAHGITARFDHLIIALTIRWILKPEQPQQFTARLMNLADRHQEFSPHFPLFDRQRYRDYRGTDNQKALNIVVDGIRSHCIAMRMKERAAP